MEEDQVARASPRRVVTQSPAGPDRDARQRLPRLDRFAVPTALVALGISWPILQLVGEAPPFFIARHSPVLDIVFYSVAIGVLLPVAAGLSAVVPGRLGRLAWLLFSALGLIGLSVPISRALSGSDVAWVVFAAIFAVGGTLFAERSATFRSLCRLLSISPLIIVAVFLVGTPSGRLAFEQPAAWRDADGTTVPAADGPFVLVVFDEFSTASIVHTDGTLRTDRYPALARLASLGAWFPRATSMAEYTEQAVPGILSGTAPDARLDPVLNDFPANLFTLAPSDIRIFSHETVTQLCPPQRCIDTTPVAGPARRWALLGADSAAALAQLVLPPFATTNLPDLTTNWTNFGLLAINGAADSPSIVVGDFIDAVSADASHDTLFFVHVLMPHRPWIFLPDGTRYDEELSSSGRAVDLAPEQRDLALQRYLLQTQYADRMIGEILDGLEADGLLDSATILVTADHGVSFDTTDGSRSPSEDTVAEVGLVPFFLKSPGLRSGFVDTYPATGRDVTPSLLDAMGVPVDELPSGGASLISGNRPTRDTMTMSGRRGLFEWTPDIRAAASHAARLDALFPTGNLFELGTIQAPATPGQQVADLGRGWVLETAWNVTRGDLDGGLSPALVIAVGPVDGAGDWIALAADDRVVAVGRSFERDGVALFEAVIDPAVVEQGIPLTVSRYTEP